MTANPLGPSRPRRAKRLRHRLSVAVALLITGAAVTSMPSAYAASYARISGSGSSWAANAITQWSADVSPQGVTVDYSPSGSSTGRKEFVQGLADFAVSEIPYTGDTSDKQDEGIKPAFKYSLLPVVAGGTSFMYNLPVNGSRYERLQLSQAALAGIFSGQITTWNAPAIAATNPGVNLPAQQITVVVRSDGSGATAQFTLWMLRQFPDQWRALCAKTGCNPNAATSYYPSQGLSNFTAQTGSQGVTAYTASTPYTINYDEYSYAQQVGFPVAGLQNQAGYYITPTDTGVAVALTQAKINSDANSENYLSQDLSGVYAYGDPRTYPISAYSYLVVPAEVEGNFNAAKGATLGYYSSYDLCEGQRSMGALGYSPLPMNLVLAAMDQVLKIPGVDAATQDLISRTQSGVQAGDANPCNNPTFRPGDDPAHNILVDSAPFPAGCDTTCQAPWRTRAAGTNGGVSGKAGGVSGAAAKAAGKSKKGAGVGAAAAAGAAAGTGTDAAAAAAAAGTSSTDPAAGGVAAAPGSAAAPVCDPDTGVCTDATDTASTAGTTTDAAIAPTSAIIGSEGTWGGPQLALAICLLLGLGVVAGPAAFSQRLRRRAGTPGTGSGNGT